MTVITSTLEIKVVDTTRDRSLTRSFQILNPEYANDERGETYIPALEISTRHDKDYKRYVTSVNRVRKGPMFVRFIMDIAGKSDPCPVNQYVATPCARYSAKELQAHHEETLRSLEGAHEALLDWATRASM